MNVLSRISPAIRTTPLGWTDLRFYAFTAAFAAGNLLVPLALHGVPNAGPMLLPLFFFTLVAAWQFGFAAGLVVAVASPLLNFFLVGMPTAAFLPVVLTKSVVLALASAALARRFGTIQVLGLVAAVAAMLAAGFLAERLVGLPLAKSADLLVVGLPGVVLLVFGGYAVLRLTNRLFGTKE